jgi:hypothetical protein
MRKELRRIPARVRVVGSLDVRRRARAGRTDMEGMADRRRLKIVRERQVNKS